MIHRIVLEFYIIVALTSSCVEKTPTGTEKGSGEHAPEFILSTLPESESNSLTKDHICYDIYDNQSIELPENIENQGFSYVNYSFDTIINKTRLLYSYRIIGATNAEAIKYRIFNNLRDDFNSMAETAKLEPKKITCLYAQMTDSLDYQNGKLIYSRYTAVTCGGAGAMESLKTYSLTADELKEILNDSEKSIDDSEIENYLLNERYF